MADVAHAPPAPVEPGVTQDVALLVALAAHADSVPEHPVCLTGLHTVSFTLKAAQDGPLSCPASLGLEPPSLASALPSSDSFPPSWPGTEEEFLAEPPRPPFPRCPRPSPTIPHAGMAAVFVAHDVVTATPRKSFAVSSSQTPFGS